MIELPGSVRDMIVERIDEEIETTGADAPDGWVACLLAGLDVAAEELDEELGENLVLRLEESGELEQSLSTVLEEQFEALEHPSGDELMRVVDTVCEVAWINEDGDDQIAKGFMESDGYEEDDY
jgi:hypothetical protein